MGIEQGRERLIMEGRKRGRGMKRGRGRGMRGDKKGEGERGKKSGMRGERKGEMGKKMTEIKNFVLCGREEKLCRIN